MRLYPAIDLFEGCAVRLYKGDYAAMTVYSRDPASVARDFAAAGAEAMHIVDLEGARSGLTPNLDTVIKLKEAGGLFCEIGGGIRSMETLDAYLSAGLDRAILGTAAVENRPFLMRALEKYGERIAVGVDILGGRVAVKGWTESSALEALGFCSELAGLGVKTLIVTDISRDGAMAGANEALYRELSEKVGVDIISSGGVSSLADLRALAALGIHGAIVGKAYYTGAIDLKEAIGAVK